MRVFREQVQCSLKIPQGYRCSGYSLHSSKRIEFVDALLFLVFAGRLVARIKLGRRGLLLLAVGGGSGIGAGLHLRGGGAHRWSVRVPPPAFLSGRQGLVIGRADRSPIRLDSVRPEHLLRPLRLLRLPAVTGGPTGAPVGGADAGGADAAGAEPALPSPVLTMLAPIAAPPPAGALHFRRGYILQLQRRHRRQVRRAADLTGNRGGCRTRCRTAVTAGRSEPQ